MKKINIAQEFSISQQYDTQGGYIFGGYVLTFDSELLGHKISSEGTKLMLAKDSVVNFRYNSKGELNLPLTRDHNPTIDGVVGNFFEVFVDTKGIYGKAITKDMQLSSKIKDRVLRNFSSEVSIASFETVGNVDYMKEITLSAVSIVGTPADSQATIIDFQKKESIKDYCLNLGLNNNEVENILNKIDSTLLFDLKKELDLTKQELHLYKIMELLNNVRN